MAEKQKELPKGNKPDYIARVKQSPNSDFYTTLGAAWKRIDKNGKEFLSVKLNLVPPNFDGSFILVEPKEDNE